MEVMQAGIEVIGLLALPPHQIDEPGHGWSMRRQPRKPATK